MGASNKARTASSAPRVVCRFSFARRLIAATPASPKCCRRPARKTSHRPRPALAPKRRGRCQPRPPRWGWPGHDTAQHRGNPVPAGPGCRVCHSVSATRRSPPPPPEPYRSAAARRAGRAAARASPPTQGKLAIAKNSAPATDSAPDGPEQPSALRTVNREEPNG